MTAGELIIACALDVVLGDPRWFPHPVRLMGRAITWYEERARRIVRRAAAERAAGVVLALGLPAAAYTLSWLAIELASRIHPMVGQGMVILLAFTTVAARDLIDHATAVASALQSGSPALARGAVSRIVGRDTAGLSEPEVVRAAVETIAESTADGIVAPLFYLALGGPSLALAYKAINTLDSMVGHCDAQYRHFGWASARLDDLANWAPARITGLLMVLAAGMWTRTLGQSWRVFRRDGWKHPSPNSGRPEAAMAGALGVQLGGMNFYDGQPSERLRIGDAIMPLSPRHIPTALHLTVIVSVIAVVLAVIVVSL